MFITVFRVYIPCTSVKDQHAVACCAGEGTARHPSPRDAFVGVGRYRSGQMVQVLAQSFPLAKGPWLPAPGLGVGGRLYSQESSPPSSQAAEEECPTSQERDCPEAGTPRPPWFPSVLWACLLTLARSLDDLGGWFYRMNLGPAAGLPSHGRGPVPWGLRWSAELGSLEGHPVTHVLRLACTVHTHARTRTPLLI